jgi:serine phosphatase RsbU (regulator of sigma subunit)
MAARKKVDRIAEHLEALQAGFHSVARAGTLNDLAKKFAETIAEMFPRTAVDLAHRPSDSADWKALVDGSKDGKDTLNAFRPPKKNSACAIQHSVRSTVAVQRLFDASSIGLVISTKRNGTRVTARDEMLVRLALSLLGNAYQDLVHRRSEKDLVFSLNHRILQLNSLIDTGIEVSTLDALSSPHRLALVRAASLTNASVAKVTVNDGGEPWEEYTFPEGAIPSGIEANAIRTHFDFSGDTYTFTLFDKESRKGGSNFDVTDQLLLDALARQVQAALENRYLHRQALEKERIERELAVAASIQQRIIPAQLPAIPGYDIAGKNIPSKSVGGDYYDCISLGDGKYALVIADVTGKGVPAALLVSSLHAFLSVYLQMTTIVPDLLDRLNKALCNATTEDKFVTAFVVVITPETGEFEYSSAGHNPGYLQKADGTIEEINVGGPPLGAFDFGPVFKSARRTIGRGERLFLYTDGVTEATNEQEELYERKYPLPGFISRHATRRPEEFIEALIVDVRKFAGSTPQSDDITMLCLSRKQ